MVTGFFLGDLGTGDDGLLRAFVFLVFLDGGRDVVALANLDIQSLGGKPHEAVIVVFKGVQMGDSVVALESVKALEHCLFVDLLTHGNERKLLGSFGFLFLDLLVSHHALNHPGNEPEIFRADVAVFKNLTAIADEIGFRGFRDELLHILIDVFGDLEVIAVGEVHLAELFVSEHPCHQEFLGGTGFGGGVEAEVFDDFCRRVQGFRNRDHQGNTTERDVFGVREIETGFQDAGEGTHDALKVSPQTPKNALTQEEPI